MRIISGKHKGKKLELYPSDWEKVGLRQEIKDGVAATPKEIFLATEEFYDGENSRYAAAALMRYLLVGKGSKDKLTKNLVREYYLNMTAVIEEMDKEEGGESYKEPETEEEEAAMIKERSERLRQREKELMEAVFERTFAEWTDKEWDRFAKYYFKSIG